MAKLSVEAMELLLHAIDTTPFGRIVIELNESNNEIAIVIEGRIKFKRPDKMEPKAGQMAFLNETKEG